MQRLAAVAIAVAAYGCATDGPRDPTGLPVTNVLAAEGLGHVEAARTYYELALASSMKCSHSEVFGTCDGLVFPDDALFRLRGVVPR